MTKSYPKDIKGVCREYRPDGPIPCLWPGCDCDGLPTGDVEAYLNGLTRKHALGADSPMGQYVINVAVADCGASYSMSVYEMGAT